MSNLQTLGNGFYKFCLASTYQRHRAAFLPKSKPFLKKCINDNGPPAIYVKLFCMEICVKALIINTRYFGYCQRFNKIQGPNII